MVRGRHRQKAPKPVRRLAAIITPALLVAAIPVGMAAWPDSDEDPTAARPAPSLEMPERKSSVSRSGDRTPIIDPSMLPETPLPTPTKTAKPKPTKTPDPTPADEKEDEKKETPTPTPEPTAVGHRYTTVALNVRAEPHADAEVVTVLDFGAEIAITDVTEGSWVQILRGDETAWVSSNYLSKSEPEPEEPEEDTSGGGSSSSGPSSAECPSGSEVESGLTPDAIRVHRALCAEFPDVTSYGGVRSGSGEHSQGRALDAMVPNSSLGDAIAAWVREHHSQLGVSEVIWAQRIWTVQRSSEGWRWMEDRGSDTANHYDHVHVTVYGDSGTS